MVILFFRCFLVILMSERFFSLRKYGDGCSDEWMGNEETHDVILLHSGVVTMTTTTGVYHRVYSKNASSPLFFHEASFVSLLDIFTP